jgi:ParB/RepB/Spo0J family partition protein
VYVPGAHALGPSAYTFVPARTTPARACARQAPARKRGSNHGVPQSNTQERSRWIGRRDVQAIQGELLELSELGTSYGRVRCLAPRQVEQMKASLTAHGQLTALVVVKRQSGLELIDGFKRRRAAEQMGWTTLRVTRMEVDEQGQWAAMLALNRATHSMSVLEEALVLREMVAAGMTQAAIGQLLNRHKSWVSRRIGLIERLHPELVEQIREGILPPGAARRLLSLPAGNQLELATVVTREGLGSQDTELLVKLWRPADPPVREFLLAHPLEALANARTGDPQEPPDPRLTPRGQRLQRHLRILQGVAPRTLQGLRPSPAAEDLEILEQDLDSTTSWLSRLVAALGSARPRES